ncbi:Tellurite resistance protein TehA [Thauera sp. GDN1]|uniref:SLAC1 family transporter n=1 Tax=Thauera sp. GDN1 TaxID=2944810 RepID=UPI002479CD3F|nr:hypothetical protein [Thauera sp. GDN1]WEN42291.1 Tellurite resistance protein TehA [Thauera sp. GDN1]
MHANASATSTATTSHHVRLAHFPVALFSTVMGIAGLTIAWLKAHHTGGVPVEIGVALRWLASALYLFLLLMYGAKLLRHPEAVKADRAHPIRLNFFPAISIGLLLLSIGWAQDAPAGARWMWGIGAAVHLIFTLFAMSSWIHHTHYDIKHANPAWFIPVVGNIIVPIATFEMSARSGQVFYAGLSWLMLAVLSGVVALLAFKTLLAASRKQICVPE